MKRKKMLDISFSNHELYRGCKVREFERGRFRLETPLDSAVVFVAHNALSLAERFAKEGFDTLELTGGVPPAIYMTVFSIMSPFFTEVIHVDGHTKTYTGIPKPPAGFMSEPE